jgi:transposase
LTRTFWEQNVLIGLTLGLWNTTEQKSGEIYLDRSQMRWATFDLEGLIDSDHPARMIWQLSGKFDLKPFESKVKTLEGEAGRPCWPARLLVSVWVYSYTLGIASARAIERMSSHEPGLRWLSGDEVINYHTLADFRVGHPEALQEVFAQFLALLETASVVDLSTLLHDGTKVKAVAGRSSLHRRKTLEKRVKEARRVVRKLDERAAQEVEAMDARRRAAQERAAGEQLARAERALKRLKELEAKTAEKKRRELRVSQSEPEARNMKHPDGGFAPSYNLQVTTEGKARMVISVGVSDAANDTQELVPAMERVKATCGKLPEQLIADNGYASRANVEAAAERNVQLIVPWKDHASREAGACATNGIAREFAPSKFKAQRGGKRLTCPAGKTLVIVQQKKQHGVLKNIFEAQASDCRRCKYRQQCCGAGGRARKIERVVESRAMRKYLAQIKRPEVRAVYRKRCEVAEAPHLWMKGVKGRRRFSVRGMAKAGMEALWIALAYNVSRLLQVCPAAAVAA